MSTQHRMDNLIFSPTSGRFSSAVTAQARVHFAEPAVDSRRILRVDVTRKESFQMEPFSPSFAPFAYFLLRGSSRASSFPIWSQPFGRCRYRPSRLTRSLAVRARYRLFLPLVYTSCLLGCHVLSWSYLIRTRFVLVLLVLFIIPS